MESVDAQMYVKHWEHLILVDRDYEGCAATMNRLAEEAAGSWIVPFADDDLLLPWFLKCHGDRAEDGDIVYSPPVVDGEDPAQFRQQPPNLPAVAMIRAETWHKLGGYEGAEQEDRRFYERAQVANVQFARVDRCCWIYRFHGANKSRGWRP